MVMHSRRRTLWVSAVGRLFLTDYRLHWWNFFVGNFIVPIANLKGHYFQPSLSVCVRLWPALLPFNVDRFWRNLVTRILLWSSLPATIMVQIGRRGTALCLFENSRKSQNSNFKILVHHFLRLCLLCIVKKIDSNKTDRGNRFEIFPYGDSGNGTAAAARYSAGLNWWCGGVQWSKLGGIPNWGRNWAVKTNWLVFSYVF